MSRLSEINLGDYVRACVELRAGPDARLEIARLLGLAEPEPAPAGAAVPPVSVADEAPIAGSGVAPAAATLSETADAAAPVREAAERSRESDSAAIPAELTRLARVRVDAWSEQLEDIPADSPFHAAPGIEPLFAPPQTRTLLSRALARVAETGPWDVVRVIERCAAAEPLTGLPRLPQPVLAGGVQLLVDRGDAMMVFAQDQAGLALTIRTLVGTGKVQVLSFDGFPASAGMGGKRRWKPYREQLPPPGTVVAVLGDIGIGQAAWLPPPARAGDWRAFAETLRRRGCPVVAFVPYAPGRWPEELKRSITMIHWDRPTRTSAIRASVGLGLRVEN
jgi:hypothetical protein